MVEQGSQNHRVSGQDDSHSTRPPSHVLDVAGVALYGVFVLATALLAYFTPITGDDYQGLQVLHEHPGLASWVSYWYTQEYGRIPGIATYFFVVQHRLLFTVLVGLTLPAIAFLTLSCALGRRATLIRHDLIAVGFLTVALWFSLPIAADVNWRTAWPYQVLPSLLMLAFVFPYRRWLGRAESDIPAESGIGAPIGMALLGAIAASSHESVLVVLVVLAAGFVWLTSRRHALRSVPSHLWAGFIGLGIGAAGLLAAPGNSVRASGQGPGAAVPMTLGAHVAVSATYVAFTLFKWLLPAYPWLVCILIATFTLSSGRPEDLPEPRRLSPSWVWLAAACLADVPFLLFPQVTLEVGERTVIFSMLLLYVAAAALLLPESSVHVLDRLTPRVAVHVLFTALLLIAVADVGGNIRAVVTMNSQLSARSRIVAQERARGVRELALPPLTYQGTRAVMWGEPTADSHNWLNEAMASYYGVESVVTTSNPNP